MYFCTKEYVMDKNEDLYKWFSSHQLFNVNGLCKLIKVNGGNFNRYLSQKKIPEKYIIKIERVIKDYGYKQQ